MFQNELDTIRLIDYLDFDVRKNMIHDFWSIMSDNL